MILRFALVLAFLGLFLACDGGSSSPSPTTTTTSIPALRISGSVTTYRFDPLSPRSTLGNISYIVTTISNRAVTGCFVQVKWLDAAGLQVEFTFAATDVSIPAGTSTITNQDLVTVAEAQRIVNSRVEYSLCR